MKTIITIILASFSIVYFSSCSRERIEPTKQLNAYKPVQEYYDTKKTEEQEIVIDTSGTGPIVGKDSTRIWIAKELLMFPDSSDVEWPFTVKLIELYVPKEMIYYQMPTVAGVKALESQGEIRVRAFKEDANGVEQELLLKPGKVFRVEMLSDTSITDMYVYYGKDAGNYTDWTNSVSSVGGNTQADLYFANTSYGYKADIGKLGWINCGKPYLGFNNLTFTSEDDDLNNVSIFAYIPKYNTLIQAQNLSTIGIQDSLRAKIILIGINSSNELYHYYFESTVTESANIPVTLTPISDADLTNILNSF